ncbi:hypothetical protein PV05_09464 [Exophiala xenobiotica]|uniref:Uncharacterized protein n=1 Tax=Exophiala xenobiotica TaxID=348802 RepID=A0A0D2E7G1_9EURO|nr:uncharacterized protein PV05_09464 [Exophiala xenobiotica]KIW50675.1 hypothetical protein PV05_09464 [Exophiala xenobiotica]
MFFKQSGYKPRTLSGSSEGSSGNRAGSPPKDAGSNNKTTSEAKGPAASPGAAGRRRSSANAETKFAGLNATKRSSVDERRANWADQKPGSPGMLQGMWNSFTKGT